MARYTEFLGITKLEPGQQQAHVVANEAFNNYDLALAGLIEVDLAGKSACSMSGRDSTHAVLRFVKTDRDCLVTIQARPKTWTIINDSARAVQVGTDYPNSQPLTVGAGLVLKVICDGTAMRAASDGLSQLEAHNQSATAHDALTANRTYYLRAGGSDQNDGLTRTTPLATVAEAKKRLRRLKTNGFTVTLDLGEGSWPAVSFREGETGDAAAVIITGAGSDLTTVASAADTAFKIQNSNTFFTLRNLALKAGINGLDVLNVKRLDISNLNFKDCGQSQISLQFTHCVFGAGLVFSGSAAVAVSCGYLTYLRCRNLQITLTGAPNFSQAFTTCTGNSYAFWAGTTFSGGATGVKYRAEYLGFISVGGGGANFFPGDRAGVLGSATGGYYV